MKNVDLALLFHTPVSRAAPFFHAVEFTMNRWIISVLLTVFLSIPAVSGAADDQLDPGRTSLFNLPFVKIPIGSNLDSKDKKEEGQAKNNETKEKEKQDKKVDDAIKKAWEER